MKKLLTNLYGFIIICSISLLSNHKALAQDNDIYELSQLNIPSTSVNNSSNVNSREPYYDLAFNLHATIYLKNGSIKNIYGDGDIKRLSLEDGNSFPLLSNKDARYSNVELLILMLKSPSDLNNLIDLTNDNGFDSLKFVFIKCYFDFEKQDIEKFIKVKTHVRVFYKLVNPS